MHLSIFTLDFCLLFTDITLTLDNVAAIMKDVQRWRRVAWWIGVSPSKWVELQSENRTSDQAKQTCWDYWLHHHPAPSWKMLADALYVEREHGALEVLLMNYLKGEYIMLYLLYTCSMNMRCYMPIVEILLRSHTRMGR